MSECSGLILGHISTAFNYSQVMFTSRLSKEHITKENHLASKMMTYHIHMWLGEKSQKD